MSKRLQVVLDDMELAGIQKAAQGQSLTVSEWVRQSLRKARLDQPLADMESKIQCVREAVRHDYPIAAIEEMLRDIDRGRSGEGQAG